MRRLTGPAPGRGTPWRPLQSARNLKTVLTLRRTRWWTGGFLLRLQSFRVSGSTAPRSMSQSFDTPSSPHQASSLHSLLVGTMCRCIVLTVHVPVLLHAKRSHTSICTWADCWSPDLPFYPIHTPGQRCQTIYCSRHCLLLPLSHYCSLPIDHCRFNRPCLNSCTRPDQVNMRACDVYARHWLATCMLA